MADYYAEHLAAGRLRACYELATPRIKEYLEAEIAHVLAHIRPAMAVLELGCGYGRVLERLIPHARIVVGIDTSPRSLSMARSPAVAGPAPALVAMDAARIGLRDGTFDLTVCVQNGICVFSADPILVLAEALRVTRPGGTVLVSSYAERFWDARLEWFEAQAAHGLLGPIDRGATGNGTIVCTDGFRATTMSPAGFRSLASHLGVVPRITEVAGSSLFCEITAG